MPGSTTLDQVRHFLAQQACEGLADVPEGVERERIRDVYLSRFPDARERLDWEGITHVRITPQWLKWWDDCCAHLGHA